MSEQESMRQISIKELNKHLSVELLDVPFEVTRYGKICAVVLPATNLKSTDNLIPNIQKGTDKPQNVQKSVEITKKQLAETIYKNRKVTTKKAIIPMDGRIYFRPNPKGGK